MRRNKLTWPIEIKWNCHKRPMWTMWFCLFSSQLWRLVEYVLMWVSVSGGDMSTILWEVSHSIKECGLFFFSSRVFLRMGEFHLLRFPPLRSLTSCYTPLWPRPVSAWGQNTSCGWTEDGGWSTSRDKIFLGQSVIIDGYQRTSQKAAATGNWRHQIKSSITNR